VACVQGHTIETTDCIVRDAVTARCLHHPFSSSYDIKRCAQWLTTGNRVKLTSDAVFGRPFVKRFALCYRTIVLSVLSCL